jgi:hypothetical protein
MLLTVSQRFNPIEGSSATIQAKLDDMADTRMTHQTAYKRHAVGSIIYFLTLVTFFGWFALQILVTKMIYSTEITEDFFTSIRTFIVLWFAGYLWNCTLLWPHTIQCLFLRRCVFAEATHIAVFHEANESLTLHETNKRQNSRLPSWVQLLVAKVTLIVDSYMTLLFADPHCRPDCSNGIFQFCPVMRNDDQSQYIIFMLRRYNFDQIKGVYLPAFFGMPSTIHELVASSGVVVMSKTEKALHDIIEGDYLEQPLESPHLYLGTKGLSTLEVEARYRAVGKNVMQMDPPFLLGTFVDEIAKPFYLYQIYVIWFWIVAEYTSGTVVIWIIVLLTACIVSWFRFRGAQALYRLSHVTDKATVLRDGQLVTINQVALVPGDIVKVSPGVIHSDMLLMTGETLVDESTLTGEATPQAKSQVDPSDGQPYHSSIHKKQTLSAGTCVIECDNYSYALVMKTASNTAKGEILRNVLVFRRHEIQFRSELPVVISFLVAYSTIIAVFVVVSVNVELAFAFILGM